MFSTNTLIPKPTTQPPYSPLFLPMNQLYSLFPCQYKRNHQTYMSNTIHNLTWHMIPPLWDHIIYNSKNCHERITLYNQLFDTSSTQSPMNIITSLITNIVIILKHHPSYLKIYSLQLQAHLLKSHLFQQVRFCPH